MRRYEAQLEVDGERGVIYVHVGGITMLRVCGLPRGDRIHDAQVDVTVLAGAAIVTADAVPGGAPEPLLDEDDDEDEDDDPYVRPFWQCQECGHRDDARPMPADRDAFYARAESPACPRCKSRAFVPVGF